MQVDVILTPSNDFFIPTQNHTGFATTAIDQISSAFIERAVKVAEPCLEIGAGYGFTAEKAIRQGGYIYVNDICKSHLEIISERIPTYFKPQLNLLSGDLSVMHNLPENYFAAILISRVLHLFHPIKILDMLKKSYKMLRPGGLIYIVCDTPYLANLAIFTEVYEKQLKKNAWPGLINNPQKYVNNYSIHWPKLINLFNKNMMLSVIKESGFEIDYCDYIARPDYPLDRQLDGRECVVAIARKNNFH